MAGGIWQNNLVKIFLTRSCLGPLFRPLLYSREEFIHFSFLDPLTDLARTIVKIRDSSTKAIAYYWLVEVPRRLFEEMFFPNEAGRALCHLLKYAQHNNGVPVAYLTQGYALSYLEHALVRDCSFQKDLIVTLTDLQEIVNSVYGMENKVFHYRNIFNEKQLDGIVDSNGYELHHFYAKEFLSILTSNLDIDQILHQESSQIENLSMFAPRKLRNAKVNTLLMLNTMK